MKGFFKENLAFLASIVLAVSVFCFLQFTNVFIDFSNSGENVINIVWNLINIMLFNEFVTFSAKYHKKYS